MSAPEERLKILKMVQEGKLSAEEAIQLIEALDEGSRAPAAGQPSTAPRSGGRWLRVRVTDTNSGKVRVNLRLPLNVVSAGLKMGAKFSPEVEGLDVEQLMQYVRSGETGQLVDVYDDQDGEHVEVFIE